MSIYVKDDKGIYRDAFGGREIDPFGGVTIHRPTPAESRLSEETLGDEVWFTSLKFPFASESDLFTDSNASHGQNGYSAKPLRLEQKQRFLQQMGADFN